MTTHNITDFLTMKANEASNGLSDSLDVYTMLHTIEKVTKELKSEIFGQVETDVNKYGKETPERNGFRVKIGSRKSWSYTDNELERLKALQKNRQELMKKAYSIESKGGVMTDENGEVIPPAEFKESQFVICEVVR